MLKNLTIVISGKVQGVRFRISALQEAEKLGLVGLTRNQPNESVYIEAQGDEESLEKFIHWCKKGPPGAEVTNTQVTEGPLKSYKGFTIS